MRIGFAFVVALYAGRIGVLALPEFFGRFALDKEEEIGFDARVRGEDAIGRYRRTGGKRAARQPAAGYL